MQCAPSQFLPCDNSFNPSYDEFSNLFNQDKSFLVNGFVSSLNCDNTLKFFVTPIDHSNNIIGRIAKQIYLFARRAFEGFIGHMPNAAPAYVLHWGKDREICPLKVNQSNPNKHEGSCFFCSERSNKQLIGSTAAYRLFYPNNPLVQKHFLVVPKNHIEKISYLSTKNLENLTHIIQLLMSLYPNQRIDFFCKQGQSAGQSVPHIHFHFILTASVYEKIMARLKLLAGIFGYDNRLNGAVLEQKIEQIKSDFRYYFRDKKNQTTAKLI